MLFSTYLSLALATAVLAAPQTDGDRRAAPSTTTKTISKCTATTSILPTSTKCTKKTTTVVSTTTIQLPATTTTTTVTATVTSTLPATHYIEVVGFEESRCSNPGVSTGTQPDVQAVSLTTPTTGSDKQGSCVSFDNEISSLLFESVPDELPFSSSCRLYAFRGVGCNEGMGYVTFGITFAQRGLCQDPANFDHINSVQIRCS